MSLSSVKITAESSISLWERAISRFKQEFTEEIYDKWISKIELFSELEQEIIMSVPSKFLRDWVQREYLDQGAISGEGIRQILLKENPNLKKVSVIYVQNEEQKIAENSHKGELVNLSKHDNIFSLGIDLNPKFTFDNFVVGKCNKLATGVAKMIANGEENSQLSTKDINPLFLYGGVGLGKTHLAQAIAWDVKENNKSNKVVYISAERFMHLFVKSLRNKEIMDFKERFRSIDVLIIDDLQFIAGKDGTQEELLNTLTSLIENDKQVVLACDRSPGDLNDIGEKLKSRISGGIVADFKCPDYETRLEILKMKSKNLDVEIEDEVLSLLASKINSSVRDLEGALKKMVANYMFTGDEINIENAKNILRDLFRTNYNSTTIEQIQKKVADHFNIKVADLKSNIRSREVARPRQIAMHLAKILTSKSLPEIGREFGGKNHATVIHAIKKIAELTLADTKFANEVKSLEEKFQS